MSRLGFARRGAACLLAALLAACAGATGLRSDGLRLSAKVASLERGLAALGPAVDRTEAHRAAHTAIMASLQLADDYRVMPPARWHNLMIQAGVRDRGLCYQWTEDLMQRMQALELKTLELHWGVAHKGSDLREHNSVVITARRQPFRQGLVLDPWRESGDLYWAVVERDSYPWEPLPRQEW